MKLPIQSIQICSICDRKAKGRHFGIVSCRACAEFFRRATLSGRQRKCVKDTDNCSLSTKSLLSCKKCRLQKCLDAGMVAENSEISRAQWTVSRINGNIPPTLDTFLGRSNLIIIRALSGQNAPDRVKNYIDFRSLMEKSTEILRKGVESPIHSENTLNKLAFGLRRVQSKCDGPEFCSLKKIGKDEFLERWERDFLKLSSWLAYFDGFRQLPQCIQLTITKTVWKMWNYLTTLANSAIYMRRLFNESQLKKMGKDTVVFDWSHVEFDMSWCSRYSMQELQLFIDVPTQWKLDELTRLMVELEPSDVELSYMLCQLCFYYVGKKYQGTVLEIVEQFQESLANDLHEHYVQEMKRTNYANRLASMMKINNLIQQQIVESRPKKDLLMVFNMIEIETSHPEMFMDM